MRWQKLESWIISARKNHSMQEIGGNIYIFGGREPSHGPKSDSLYSYNIGKRNLILGEKGYFSLKFLMNILLEKTFFERI